ncbi:phage tail tip lysozyme [Entomobacter blattae]|uniref:Phage tail lysozyme n=1 Tax=Entomobacter blattae TaxID=2762277 RepID=A0A7H1NR74_9PROT|nr:phage tail tip lysozyme [Entomobacter blattae]QNT78284.1 Phage tail lysozyme [Entomobacter blattae]
MRKRPYSSGRKKRTGLFGGVPVSGGGSLLKSPIIKASSQRQYWQRLSQKAFLLAGEEGEEEVEPPQKQRRTTGNAQRLSLTRKLKNKKNIPRSLSRVGRAKRKRDEGDQARIDQEGQKNFAELWPYYRQIAQWTMRFYAPLFYAPLLASILGGNDPAGSPKEKNGVLLPRLRINNAPLLLPVGGLQLPAGRQDLPLIQSAAMEQESPGKALASGGDVSAFSRLAGLVQGLVLANSQWGAAEGTRPGWTRPRETRLGETRLEGGRVGAFSLTWPLAGRNTLGTLGGRQNGAGLRQGLPALGPDVSLQGMGGGSSFPQGAFSHSDEGGDEGGKGFAGGVPQRIATILRARHWDTANIAAILARISLESGFDPTRVGDNGQAHGLLQWHPEREANFVALFGHPLRQASIEEQALFIDWELRHTEQAAGHALSQADTAWEAGYTVSRRYVRPGLTHQQREREARRTAQLAMLLAQNQARWAMGHMQAGGYAFIGSSAFFKEEIPYYNTTLQGAMPRGQTSGEAAYTIARGYEPRGERSTVSPQERGAYAMCPLTANSAGLGGSSVLSMQANPYALQANTGMI